MKLKESKVLFFLIVGTAIVLAALSVGARYKYLVLIQRKKNLEVQNTGLRQALTLTEEALSRSEGNLSNAEKDNADLGGVLLHEQAKNQTFAAQIQDISGTVGSLQKLSRLDPELLQKYSRVYFLSENYMPDKLVQIDSQYIYDKSKNQQILRGVSPFLERMIRAAAQDNTTLKVISAYRSFSEQASVKYNYKLIYGTGANQFSADQGYSEHQLGTTVDFTTPEINGLFAKFEGTDEYTWLSANAHKFGFMLSYPKNNTYYQFEPWHWRFVGVALATKLHDEGKYFYDLSQREIDPFLITIFD